jgi:hypothetical protein
MSKLPNGNIGEPFTFLIPMLTIYVQYINGYDEAIKALKRLKKNKDFAELCVKGEEKSTTLNKESKFYIEVSIESLLVAPIQRLPRYELLLRELIKHTPEVRYQIYEQLGTS